MKGTLTFDVETHSADLLYSMQPERFVRLIGYRWRGDDDVTLTTDLEELRTAIRSARWIVGHNIHAFDMRAVFGPDSNEPLEMAQQGRVYDTWVHAALVHPAPHTYTNRHGKEALADTPGKMRKWFSLDEQAYQLGVPGKTHDLKALADEFGGFGEIPVGDPRFRDYLVGDVLASEHVARELLKKGPLDRYAIREQHIAARAAIISSNGLRVDRDAAQARVDELAARREEILSDLQARYGLPANGAAPWDTTEGKAAILAALADYGITPDTVDWPTTPVASKREKKIREAKDKAEGLDAKITEWREQLASGELPDRSVAARERWIERAEAEAEALRDSPLPPGFGLSMAGDVLKSITEGTAAADLGVALAELKGQRSLSQLALDSTHPDGKVHPDITMLQRSGRWSTTNPGLTIWTSRGPGKVEKSYFIPDTSDEVLLEIDYSNADARVVAALSGDTDYAERFQPGADGHMINAVAAWGEAVVSTDPDGYRFKAKALGHGWNYGGRAKTLSRQSGVPLEAAREFVSGMDATYSRLVKWQNHVRKQAEVGYVVNPWGRRMWVEKGHEFTQAPALMGQSGTREIVCDALLAMPVRVLRTVKAQIHDALLFSIPRDRFEACRDYLMRLMESEMSPRGGQRVSFPVGAGKPGANWMDAHPD